MSTASEAIVRLHSLLEGMLSKPEYNFPIVAAQYQYRERYYGLSSAAMLEDLFFDAMSNYISTTSPGTVSLVLHVARKVGTIQLMAKKSVIK